MALRRSRCQRAWLRRDLLRRSGLTEAVGEARVYRTLADAGAALRS